MSVRPEISLADLIRAVDGLSADGPMAGKIAQLLGLDAGEPQDRDRGNGQRRSPHRGEGLPPSPGPSPPTPRSPPPAPRPRPALRDEPRIPEAQADGRRFLLEEVTPRVHAQNVGPMAPASVLETLRATRTPVAVPADPGLFPMHRERAILGSALSSEVAEREVDVDRLVEILGSAGPVERLPYRPSYTLRKGVQVLSDEGDGMQPFREDMLRLRGSLTALLGEDGLAFRRFLGCPGRGTAGGEGGDWEEYRSPPSGTPVLLLSDLGVARPRWSVDRAPPAEWGAFIDGLDQAGCPLLVLLPYPRRRVDPALRRRAALIQWDRHTGVHEVRRALARIGGRP